MNYEKLRELFYNEVFQEQEPETGEDGRQHGLYVIQNVVNGRFYVGKHSRDKEDNYFGSGVALKGAVRKYGKSNFQMKYFHWSESAEQLHADESEVLEILLNEIFDGDWSELKKCSYNLKLNAGLNSDSQETRAKKSASQTGKKHSDETRAKKRYTKLGKLNPNFLGIVIGVNKENEVVVFYGSQDINSRQTRSGKFFNKSAISGVLNGRNPHHHGFKFHRTADRNELESLLSADFYDATSKQVLELICLLPLYS